MGAGKKFGDPRYLSPEAMKAMMKFVETRDEDTIPSFGPEIDVWAMGVTIYEFLAKGDLPFLYEPCNIQELKAAFPRLKKGILDKEDVKFLEEALFSTADQDLLRSVLQKNPDLRATSAAAVNHEWFDSAGETQISRGHRNSIRFDATRDTVRQVMRNQVAAKLRYEHVDHCFQVFSKFDPDNSGSLSLQEFTEAWRQISPASSTFASEAFTRADVDKNGVLEFNEFVAIT